MNAVDRLGYVERARLVARAALLLSIAPALFYVWQAIGVPGIPGLDFGSPGALADHGLVVRVAATPHGPVRVGPLRARVAAGTHGAHSAGPTVKPAIAEARSSLPALSPPAVPKTPAARTPEATPTSRPPTAPDVQHDVPVAAPATVLPSVQVPALPSLPTVPSQLPAAQVPSALPSLPVTQSLPALPTPSVNVPALP